MVYNFYDCFRARFQRKMTSCFRKRKDSREAKKKSFTTPLPWTKLIVLCAVLFVSQFGINMIFPFLPFMVHDFFPYLDKEELGKKAGYLGGAYFLGNFFGSLIWGIAADKLGRRTVLLMGVSAIIVCELFFGFSQNMLWALSARLMWGVLNGNIGVAKTYISEICDDSNQAKGFAAVGTTGGIGRLMGSVVGGFLAQPANKYSIFQFHFFCDYPYSLPCLVAAGLSLCSLIGAWLYLDETLKKDKITLPAHEPSESQDSGIDSANTGSNSSDNSSTNRSHDGDEIEEDILENREDNNSDMIQDDYNTDSEYDASSDTELLQNIRRINRRKTITSNILKYTKTCMHVFSPIRLARKVLQRLMESVGVFVFCMKGIRRIKCSGVRTASTKDTVVKYVKLSLKTIVLLKDRKIILSIFLYGTVAFVSIIINELFPLLMVTDHEHGGYNMDPSEIGVVLSAGAVMQLLFQSLAYPRIVKLLKYRYTCQFGLFLFAMGCIVLPFSNQISGPIPAQEFNSSASGSGMIDDSAPFCGYDVSTNSTAQIGNSITRVPFKVWVIIMMITALQIVGRVVAITTTMVFISNSSVPATRSTVNGYGQSLAAVARMVGPMSGSPFFAWSETLNKHWPLNYHLVFDLMAVSTIGASILVLLLPKSIEKKREISNDGSISSNSGQSLTEDNSNVELVSVTALQEEIDDDSEQSHLFEVKKQ